MMNDKIVSLTNAVVSHNQHQLEHFLSIINEFKQLESQNATKGVNLEARVKELEEKEFAFEQQKMLTEEKLRRGEEEFQMRQKQWDQISEKLHRSTTRIGGRNQKVKLNIGGMLFMTTVDTLRNEPDTYFSCLLSEHFDTSPDEDGEIFVDRDPTFFRFILNHLRGADVSKDIESLKENEKAAIAQEVDYYQIASMFHFFKTKFGFDRTSVEDGVVFDGFRATASQPTNTLFINCESRKRMTFEVTLFPNGSKDSFIGIGFASKQKCVNARWSMSTPDSFIITVYTLNSIPVNSYVGSGRSNLLPGIMSQKFKSGDKVRATYDSENHLLTFVTPYGGYQAICNCTGALTPMIVLGRIGDAVEIVSTEE